MKFLSAIPTLTLTFLTSCTSSLEKRLDVNTIENKRPAYQITQPEPLNLTDVTYYVLTPDNVNEVFEKLKKQGIEPVIIGTTVDGFTTIVINNVKIQQLIQKYQKDIIEQNNYYTENKN